jgi:hypothetical protein
MTKIEKLKLELYSELINIEPSLLSTTLSDSDIDLMYVLVKDIFIQKILELNK